MDGGEYISENFTAHKMSDMVYEDLLGTIIPISYLVGMLTTEYEKVVNVDRWNKVFFVIRKICFEDIVQ